MKSSKPGKILTVVIHPLTDARRILPLEKHKRDRAATR